VSDANGLLGHKINRLPARWGLPGQESGRAGENGETKPTAHDISGLSAGRQIRDYHTARTRNRFGVVVGHAVVTRRDYLIDSKFLVMVDGEVELLNEMQRALQDPVWFTSLGRRSCVPSSPILLEKRLGVTVQITLRVEEARSGGMLLRDLPVSFSARTHGQRMISVSPQQRGTRSLTS
jgi:CRISPR-associated protein (Cas_Cas5)